MIEREAASIQVSAETVFGAFSGRSFPSLDRMLAIARTGSRDPSALTQQDIEDLSRVMLMHYTRMGVA